MKEKTKSVLRAHFSATHIAYMALFTALAFAASFLDFPIFPAVPLADQLKLDFANVFFMFEGFIFGPVEAVISILIKELLCWTRSTTMGVGQLANFIMSTAYILVPSIVYRFKKGRWWVALYLAVACVIQVGIGFLVNRFVNFPFFGWLYHFDGVAGFRTVWPFVIYFNLIKSVSVSVIVFIAYKPLSRVVRLTAEKFARRKRKARTHKLHLADAPYALIAGGEKTVEVRLYDERRKEIQVGDTLAFRKTGEKKSALRARVTALYSYASFTELFSAPDMLQRTGNSGKTPEEAAEGMREYYTKEQEERDGVLGIEIELLG